MRLLFLCGIIYIVGGSIGCAAKQATKGEPKRSEAILPGANRIYPSQQSAQETRPGAGEAFPSSGGASSSYRSPSSSSTPYGSPSSPGTGARSSSGTDAPQSPSSSSHGSASSPSTAGSPSSPSTAGSPSTNTSPTYGSTPSREAAAPVYFSVQLWASVSEEKAKQRKDALQREFDVPLRVVSSNGRYLVCAGEFSIEQEALALQRRTIARGIVDAQVVSVPAVPSRP